eukprot:TRINITY_DN22838_c1_g2_i2.p1 TRINITY_DN22838_c1_g2~~TRINITY_DN22838_c1_g2_i2.p1  ORF type:complete len:355 (-),score=-15.17 TRINITY_DN22838_c1_g2_i2:139-1203(-)
MKYIMISIFQDVGQLDKLIQLLSEILSLPHCLSAAFTQKATKQLLVMKLNCGFFLLGVYIKISRICQRTLVQVLRVKVVTTPNTASNLQHMFNMRIMVLVLKHPAYGQIIICNAILVGQKIYILHRQIVKIMALPWNKASHVVKQFQNVADMEDVTSSMVQFNQVGDEIYKEARKFINTQNQSVSSQACQCNYDNLIYINNQFLDTTHQTRINLHRIIPSSKQSKMQSSRRGVSVRFLELILTTPTRTLNCRESSGAISLYRTGCIMLNFRIYRSLENNNLQYNQDFQQERQFTIKLHKKFCNTCEKLVGYVKGFKCRLIKVFFFLIRNSDNLILQYNQLRFLYLSLLSYREMN